MISCVGTLARLHARLRCLVCTILMGMRDIV